MFLRSRLHREEVEDALVVDLTLVDEDLSYGDAIEQAMAIWEHQFVQPCGFRDVYVGPKMPSSTVVFYPPEGKSVHMRIEKIGEQINLRSKHGTQSSRRQAEGRWKTHEFPLPLQARIARRRRLTPKADIIRA
ncbi:MAG TPA: hypothetical protein PK609_01480 [Candidatus Paceibacterota bacterium]|nr:hypothetical protein [Candidatus Paceibacterota bacterium]